MGWKLRKRKDKKEKEYLDWLYRKAREGVNPSRNSAPTEDVNTSYTVGLEVTVKSAPITVTGITCPKCGSKQIRSAGYGSRFECKKCGKVFAS